MTVAEVDGAGARHFLEDSCDGDGMPAAVRAARRVTQFALGRRRLWESSAKAPRR